MFPYDNRIFAVDWDPTEQIVTDYFSTQESTITDQIQQDIHVYPHDAFQMSSSAVGEALNGDKMIDY